MEEYRGDSSGPTEEQILIRQLKRGEMGSYEIIFHRYYSLYFQFAKGMLKDEQAAEDILQNVFMKIWMKRERLNENQSIRNYIYVLTKREILNHFRLKYHSQVILTEEIRQFDMADKHKIQELDYHELRETVQQVIDCMPPRRRDIYCMSRLKSIPNKEIAQQLGISIRTVEKHLELALQTFRKQLGDFLFILVYLGFKF
ncbi:RNA polymerase sigma-70 factor [Petrimonas mucosa]|jgi:RNA polymerase sigma-70 factor (ECF subfamily)|uniref:RNA polymerase sigma factor SigZ n=1 Tax=Petrimonas mucosa TaxID=1642646 RepID=A0A1G4G6L9_9BACT|nr:RNA polymerase sigma-70 factor [Petrimonas mucosa]MDD3561948.1 RNA polymerase sigma-70 factor [Petrimonas mucosa]SCM57482.1 RNA polymerase sigma factor SigZ [Petrimonas mucosa]SFU33427.1 RNA polymerase sigma-70 factor, ECF subfamily [Porphyromonadaceae bacterium KHP3R9]HHT29138.1 RNA polymerase sigma-70 factor [Petrimonas mucosa]